VFEWPPGYQLSEVRLIVWFPSASPSGCRRIPRLGHHYVQILSNSYILPSDAIVLTLAASASNPDGWCDPPLHGGWGAEVSTYFYAYLNLAQIKNRALCGQPWWLIWSNWTTVLFLVPDINLDCKCWLVVPPRFPTPSRSEHPRELSAFLSDHCGSANLASKDSWSVRVIFF
jgi:hypothetical protein